jgi:hypothetical protein
MSHMKSLLLAATLGAAIASPVLAIEIGADAKLAGAPADMTTMKMVEDSAFKGNEVRTLDQIVIGQVDGVMMGADGSTVVLIALNGDIASKSSVKTFTVPVPADTTADGSVTLGWTEADLFKALDSGLEPMSN